MAGSSFNELNDELEAIIIELQSGDKDIDEVLKKYERGIELIGKLEKHLSEADNKIRKIKPTNRK